MSPVLESVCLFQVDKMGSGACPTEKTAPEWLLGNQEKQKEATSLTIPSEAGKRSKAGLKGLLSPLEPWAHRWAVPSVVLNLMLILILIILLIAQSAKKPEPCPSAPVRLVAACPDGWVRYQGKCYYFSEIDADWDSSQSNCSAHGASLAGIDTTQEMDFMKRYKDTSHYWIGLRRDPGQPWKWTNSTEFNNWFPIQGGEKCAFLNNNDVGSSRCSSKDRWICSKLVEKIEGKAKYHQPESTLADHTADNNGADGT